MKIKPRPKMTKSRRSYLKWAGLLPPKKQGRLSRRNKANKRLKKIYKSEFLIMVERIEAEKAGGK